MRCVCGEKIYRMTNVGMVSLGCPKNLMDAELMLAKLQAAGFTITPDSSKADVVIINTCGFIQDAMQEAIDTILEFAAKKAAGEIRGIVVTGCLAQRYKEELCRELPECDAVLGLGANGDIVAAVQAALNGETMAKFPALSQWPLDGDRLQSTPPFYAYLRIADGCDNRCTYCAIPLIRGGLRSRKMETVLGEARELAARGVKEITLVAQDPTVYGMDLVGRSLLPELLTELCKIDGPQWIRLLYCYPEHITDELLEVIAREEKIVKYLDMPVQHASGAVLKAMNRKADKESLTALMRRIRETVPGIVLRTTVLVGFPGETEEDFAELCEFVSEVKFERLGCFAFSPQEGTLAAELPNQLSEDVKQERRDAVMALQTTIADAYAEAQAGKVKTVLVEGFEEAIGLWYGRSAAEAAEIDPKIYFGTEQEVQPGDMVEVRILDRWDCDLVGERT